MAKIYAAGDLRGAVVTRPDHPPYGRTGYTKTAALPTARVLKIYQYAKSRDGRPRRICMVNN